MAVQVETLDKLERRITLSLPAATIASEVESRLRRLSRTVKADGFRFVRQGADERRLAALRLLGAQRGAERQGRAGVFRRGERGQAARCRRPRASPRRKARPRRRGRLRRDLRGLSRGEDRRPVRRRGRTRLDRGRRRGVSTRTLDILRKQRRTFQQRPPSSRPPSATAVDDRLRSAPSTACRSTAARPRASSS